MAPWDIPPISEKDTPCTGGSDDYLETSAQIKFCRRRKKHCRVSLPGGGSRDIHWPDCLRFIRFIRQTFFHGLPVCPVPCGFRGIKDYIASHTPLKKPDCMYFSLGDRECHTRNKFLKCVQQNTETIEAFYHGQGIDTTFQLNPGNHFKDGVPRTAAGLQWILNRTNDEEN